MIIKRLSAISTIGIAALVLAACGSSGSAGSAPSSSGGAAAATDSSSAAPAPAPSTSASAAPTSSPSAAAPSGTGKTLTVWYMNGDYSQATMDAMAAEFTKQTGAKVNLQLQQWTGIGTKLSTALATSNPPDVIDMGNTQVAGYAANGALMDVTSHKAELEQGQTWLAGLEDPATIDGKLFAVPGFAGDRAVIYNKKMWADAGITTVPTTFDEFTADLTKIAAAHKGNANFSPMYVPGQDWYVGMQFVWDAGGDVATFANGKWASGFSSPQAQQGLSDFKAFQNQFSTKASQTLNTDKPPIQQILADGNTSAIAETNAYIGLIEKANPKITDADLGTFPFPGKSGKNQTVMLGGSDWGIAAKSQNQDLALAFVKVATSPQMQEQWVFGHDKWIPNTVELATKAAATVPELQKAFFTASLISKATPASPNWATIENNQDINQLFSAIASGSKTVQQAASDFDKQANSILNGGS